MEQSPHTPGPESRIVGTAAVAIESLRIEDAQAWIEAGRHSFYAPGRIPAALANPAQNNDLSSLFELTFLRPLPNTSDYFLCPELPRLMHARMGASEWRRSLDAAFEIVATRFRTWSFGSAELRLRLIPHVKQLHRHAVGSQLRVAETSELLLEAGEFLQGQGCHSVARSIHELLDSR